MMKKRTNVTFMQTKPKGDNVMKNRINVTFMGALMASMLLLSTFTASVNACTGISLKNVDKSFVYGRTFEWGAFELNTRVTIVPRGTEFTGLTPDGLTGKKWTAKYGVVGLDILEKMAYIDGMNEKGLTVGLYYHLGFAQYPEYDPSKAKESITAMDLGQYLLTQFATIDEVKEAMNNVRVIPVIEEAIGIPVQAHFIVNDPQGRSIVIEWVDGKVKIFDNPLGIITNSPTFDWHMTNLRNYSHLPTTTPSNAKIQPIGSGSSMMGLPADATSPSRFVRAAAATQTARTTTTASEGIYELFRILDNFNVTPNAGEGTAGAEETKGSIRSATQATMAWDTQKKILYYHTKDNRRIRKIDVAAIDFSKIGDSIIHMPVDTKPEQDIEEITIGK